MLRLVAYPTLVLLSFAQTGPMRNQEEVAQHEQPLTFKTAVNQVNVPVVVRDAKGRAVGGLTEENFQLYDRGRLQTIVQFTMEVAVPLETPGPAAKGSKLAAENQPALEVPSSASVPDRFVAYLFDDAHATVNNLAVVRDAASRHLSKLDAKTRAAIYTISGQTMLDFTGDRKKWQETLARLSLHPIAGAQEQDCPDLTYFWADRIRNQNDPGANTMAVEAASACSGDKKSAALMVLPAVARVIARHEQESHVSLDVLRGLVQRMSTVPGERTIVLSSPGFLTLIGSKDEESTIIDRAIRAKVVINALDVRGLDAEAYDVAKRPLNLPPGLQR